MTWWPWRRQPAASKELIKEIDKGLEKWEHRWVTTNWAMEAIAEYQDLFEAHVARHRNTAECDIWCLPTRFRQALKKMEPDEMQTLIVVLFKDWFWMKFEDQQEFLGGREEE